MPIVSVNEAAKILGISPDAVRKRVQRGLLDGYKDNRKRVRVRLSEPTEDICLDNGWTNETSETSRLLKIIEDQQDIIRTLVQDNAANQEDKRLLVSKVDKLQAENEKMKTYVRNAIERMKKEAATL